MQQRGATAAMQINGTLIYLATAAIGCMSLVVSAGPSIAAQSAGCAAANGGALDASFAIGHRRDARGLARCRRHPQRIGARLAGRDRVGGAGRRRGRAADADRADRSRRRQLPCPAAADLRASARRRGSDRLGGRQHHLRVRKGRGRQLRVPDAAQGSAQRARARTASASIARRRRSPTPTNHCRAASPSTTRATPGRSSSR